MSKQLIVNSDDYCRTPGVSGGIREAYLNGIVTSTTCMMNMPAAVEDIHALLEEAPGLQMGVHLVLTSGQPLLPADQVSTLLDEEGHFFPYFPFLEHLDQIDPDEALAEWRAQIEKFIEASGRKPTHFDSHHHSSFFTEPFFERMLGLAQEFDCPIRFLEEQPSGDIGGMPEEVYHQAKEYLPRLSGQAKVRRPLNFISSFYDEDATHEKLVSILTNLPEGVSELMCHPGFADEQIIAGSIYARQRQRELEILTGESIKELVDHLDIELISFADLKSADQ